MTPTPIALLLVALFWTLPASVAALAYRMSGPSIEWVKHAVTRVLGAPQPTLHPHPDA